MAAVKAPGVEADPPLPVSVGGMVAGNGAGTAVGGWGVDVSFPTRDATSLSAGVRLTSLSPILLRMGQFELWRGALLEVLWYTIHFSELSLQPLHQRDMC